MKLLVVSSLWPPAGGGAEIVARRTARLLAARGDEVIVVRSARPDEPRYREQDEEGMKVICYRPWNVGTVFNLSKFGLPRRTLWHMLDATNFLSAKIFRRILEKERPDAVISHGLKGLGYLLPRTAKKFGTKTIHVLHDVQLIEPSGIAELDVVPTASRRLWSAYTRKLFGSPDAVLFPSHWLMELSKKWGFFPESSCRVVRNPVESVTRSDLLGRSDLVPAARSRTARTLLFLGQLERHKGIRELLQAARVISSDYRLLVVGDGALADLVRAEAARNPRVSYLGRREGAALEEVWTETDLVIVPSICAENAPNVIQEAANRGLPVIASRTGGIPELVKEGETGILVPPGDVSVLSQAIEAQLGKTVNDEMRQAMSDLARSWSSELFLGELKAVIA